jgi:RNA polymerase sigma-70 factor (ECF subfamily)
VAVRGTQAGPTDDFDELYQQWWGDVVALCRRLLGRVSDAEDAAQEAFLRAWLARDQYSSAQPYWPWLATIARRLCIDWQRRLAREPSSPDIGEPDVVLITPERAVLAGEELETAFEVMDALCGRDRRALVLRELGGWSYRRIAEVEGMSVEAVRGALKRARATLRRSALHHDVFGSVPGDVFGPGVRADDQEERTVTRCASEHQPSVPHRFGQTGGT